MMLPIRPLLTLVVLVGVTGAAEARLAITDKLSTYRRSTTEERIDFATRMAKSFSILAPGLDRSYFVKCLEETTNIGNPRELELDAAVKLCVTAYRAPGEPPDD